MSMQVKFPNTLSEIYKYQASHAFIIPDILTVRCNCCICCNKITV